MHESPTEIRRRAMKWTNDAGEYTPTSTLLERLSSFLAEGFQNAPERQEVDNRSEVSVGTVKDITGKSLASYSLYRKAHFSGGKCCAECPFCNRAKKCVDESATESIIHGINEWADLILADTRAVTESDSDNSAAQQLVSNIEKRGHPHPFMRNTIMWSFKDDPKSLVMVELQAFDGYVYVTGLQSSVQKKGYGEYIMKLIIDEADKLGVTLRGIAKPFGTKDIAIPKAKLVAFYKKLGFKVEPNGEMTKEPK